jgi:deoxyribodipyrimidine photo-lyase
LFLHQNPTRDAAQRQLTTFVPSAGRAYADRRNYDYGPSQRSNVSVLSPYIRHRLITESEVVQCVLQAHSPAAAEKFIQEVCWRTYWKGWLEQRPDVWSHYLADVAAERAHLRDDDGLAAAVASAMDGTTGIECFDAWSRELVETGYLHNHARMWFASIWIFTLRLPWVMGADFFLRHLLDGDPASNTLSWRWVAGLHTAGKTYLARADNIANFTSGRFEPARDELASFAVALDEVESYERIPLRSPTRLAAGTRAVLLVTEEDLSPESWPLAGVDVVGVAMVDGGNDAANYGPLVQAFKAGARADASARAAGYWGKPVVSVGKAPDLTAFAHQCGASAVVTTMVPVGYVRSEMSDWSHACAANSVPLLEISRRWDSLLWPYAKAGFFQLKARIPSVLAELNLVPQGKLL